MILFVCLAATVHAPERELSGSGGPSLDSSALRSRVQQSGCRRVSVAPRSRRPRQRQGVSAFRDYLDANTHSFGWVTVGKILNHVLFQYESPHDNKGISTVAVYMTGCMIT